MSTQPLHTLAVQQQALLQGLLARPGSAQAREAEEHLHGVLDTRHIQAARGLTAYQANGHAMAERALLSAYPVVAALIGADNFALLARDLWHQHPPQRGDLAQWGDALPGFLQHIAQLADVPYLSDVARTEWALHAATGAADAAPDPASFARLAQEAPEGLALTLAPGTAVVCSAYPVASLIGAHRDATPRLDEAARRLRDGQGEHALVWRQGHRVRLQGIDPSASALLRALLAGADLPQALDAVFAEADGANAFDFSAWLNAAVTDALVTGVHSLASLHPTSRKHTP
ncbi:MAG: putative DNA-binding domain-containing protein [Hydrogenophaga sp.]|uniref:HvfC/BufC N-terminal domain-containing protein n=1 Tax=Hydrogenophaga sp. TaxID=1904254 RepID=UPI001BBB0545|nr:DNA-binding domain-containing protein [Hydrogenophaga sp.]MBS3910676.1 putative DNA-binding domain-containing protein [Hydrogenophaga sp.]MDP2165687.1 DNA-binding domain-containing protein [Hydrogenophaga sp.]MDP3475560.1 DNA-binding domain-containing protein [Hydrogenophaga sp.]